MSPKNIRTALSMSVVVPAFAVFLGAGSATAQDQNPAAQQVPGTYYRGGFASGIYDYAPGHGPAPGIYDYAPGYGPASDMYGYDPAQDIYDYAPGYGPAPCFGPNCGLPGGHPASDYFKRGNGDHGNDGGNGG